MPQAYQHVSRDGKVYYLHMKHRLSGKFVYHFSQKQPEDGPDQVPDGYEVFEEANGQVFLTKREARLVTDEELRLVERLLKESNIPKNYLAIAKKNTIVIYSYQTSAELDKHFSSFLLRSPAYSEPRIYWSSPTAMLGFVLEDKKKRLFQPKRWKFSGAHEGWISLGSPDLLEPLARGLIPHVDKESFYDLHSVT